MKARASNYPGGAVVAFGGLEFVKGEWRIVPVANEDEAIRILKYWKKSQKRRRLRKLRRKRQRRAGEHGERQRRKRVVNNDKSYRFIFK
jgi:hypothetical protein